MNRKSARVLVFKENKLLVMYRNKFGKKYVTLIGGKIDLGEQPEQTVIREAFEEASIKVANPRLVFIDQADFYGDQYVYFCDYLAGEPTLNPNSQEFSINKMGKNLYQPGWLEISKLPEVVFLSPELKQAILDTLKNGWSSEPVSFTSKRTI